MKAVIFDIGGVLAEDVWENLLVGGAECIASQYKLDAGMVEKVGGGLWEAFAYVPESGVNDWRALERRYWESFIKVVWGDDPPIKGLVEKFIALTESFVKPIPGMKPILERLRSEGIGLAICSNNNEFWYRRQMHRLRLHRFFGPEKTILSCRIGVSKSSPGYEMFHAAVDCLGVTPSECAFVDNRERNVDRAKEVGMHGIVFTDAAQTSTELTAAGF